MKCSIWYRFFFFCKIYFLYFQEVNLGACSSAVVWINVVFPSTSLGHRSQGCLGFQVLFLLIIACFAVTHPSIKIANVAQSAYGLLSTVVAQTLYPINSNTYLGTLAPHIYEAGVPGMYKTTLEPSYWSPFLSTWGHLFSWTRGATLAEVDPPWIYIVFEMTPSPCLTSSTLPCVGAVSQGRRIFFRIFSNGRHCTVTAPVPIYRPCTGLDSVSWLDQSWLRT